MFSIIPFTDERGNVSVFIPKSEASANICVLFQIISSKCAVFQLLARGNDIARRSEG